MRFTLALLALVLAGCGASADGPPVPSGLVLAAGTQGRLASSEPEGRRRAPWIEAASSREAFVALWNRYVPGEPDETAAAIDFSTEIAVFLLLGPQETGGYAIEPVGVTVEGATVKVRARLVQPMKPEDFTTQAISAPYAVVRAPAVTYGRIEWIDADGRLLATRTAQ